MSGIMLNLDLSQYWLDAAHRGVRATKEDMVNYISQYKNTQISDFVINVAAKEVFFPTEKVSCFFEKYGKLEKGSGTYDMMGVMYDAFYVQKIDAYKIWTKELRESGINTWLSIRMNDVHDEGDLSSAQATSFDKKVRNVRCDQHRPLSGEHSKDYAQPVVYEHFLSIVREIMDNYDMDGLELDFMREPLCLGVGSEHEGKEVMTRFIKDSRSILDEAEKRYGHKIMLSARVPSTPEAAVRFGFDVFTWSREKLVDVLIPCPRWQSTDTDIPVDIWKGFMGDSGVKLFPGQEVLVEATNIGEKRWMFQSPESALGSAAAYFSQGADGVYVFNFFLMYVEDCRNYVGINSVCDPKRYHEFLSYGGNPETIQGQKRRNIVTIHDLSHMANGARGVYYHNPLPFDCKGPSEDGNYRFHDLRIATGGTQPREKVQAIIGVKFETPVDGTDLDVYLDKLHASYTGNTLPFNEVSPTGTVWGIRLKPVPGGADWVYYPLEAPEDEKYFIFDIPAEAGLPGASILQIASNGPSFRVIWAELRIGD